MTEVIASAERRYALGASRHHCGLGECYEASDVDDPRRRVVVKRMRGAVDAPGLRARFDGVSAALRGLSSPRVVRVLDAGWSDGPFVVLDAPKVPSLWQWTQEVIAGQTQVALTTVCRVVEDLCHAVEAAHRARPANALLHGTLCAQSVLVIDPRPETLRLKVTDFGLWPFARGDLATMLPSSAADPRAPELLARPDALTAACDQFSLGVLLAALLALPAGGPTAPGWGQLLREQPEALGARLRGLRDDVRGSVREVLARSLHPDPTRRFEGVEAFRGALLSADWRPAERVAVNAGRTSGRGERPLDDFERVWGDAWKERAGLGVLPSGLRASEPEAKAVSVMRAPTQPAARAAAREPDETVVSAVKPRTPWRAPTPAAARAAEETLREETVVTPVRPRRPQRAARVVNEGQNTLVDDGGATLLDAGDGSATLLDVGSDRVTPLDEGTVQWVAPPRRVVEAVAQTLVMEDGPEEWMGGGGGYDAGGDTLLGEEGEEEDATATISVVPGAEERERTQAVVWAPQPVVRAPRVDPGAWDGARIEATLPMQPRERSSRNGAHPSGNHAIRENEFGSTTPDALKKFLWALVALLGVILVGVVLINHW